MVDENSINQNELWNYIAIGSYNKVVGKGNTVTSRCFRSITSHARVLLNQLNNSASKLRSWRRGFQGLRLSMYDDSMQVERARHELFKSSLLGALWVKGINLFDMHVVALIPHAPLSGNKRVANTYWQALYDAKESPHFSDYW